MTQLKSTIHFFICTFFILAGQQSFAQDKPYTPPPPYWEYGYLIEDINNTISLIGQFSFSSPAIISVNRDHNRYAEFETLLGRRVKLLIGPLPVDAVQIKEIAPIDDVADDQLDRRYQGRLKDTVAYYKEHRDEWLQLRTLSDLCKRTADNCLQLEDSRLELLTDMRNVYERLVQQSQENERLLAMIRRLGGELSLAHNGTQSAAPEAEQAATSEEEEFMALCTEAIERRRLLMEPAVSVHTPSKLGSGVLINLSRYTNDRELAANTHFVLTAFHVISEPKDRRLEDGITIEIDTPPCEWRQLPPIYEAQLLAYNEEDDVALLSFESDFDWPTMQMISPDQYIMLSEFLEITLVGRPGGRPMQPSVGIITLLPYAKTHSPQLFGTNARGESGVSGGMLSVYLSRSKQAKLIGLFRNISSLDPKGGKELDNYLGHFVAPEAIADLLDEYFATGGKARNTAFHLQLPPSELFRQQR